MIKIILSNVMTEEEKKLVKNKICDQKGDMGCGDVYII